MGNITKNADGHVLTFTFGDRDKRVVNIDDFSAETRDRAMVHGFLQVLGDSYAGAATAAKDSGGDVLAEAIGRFDARMEGLKNGWTARATGGTPREATIDLGILAQTIATVRGKPVDRVTAVLEKLRADKKHGEVRGWRDQPDILPAYNKALAKAGRAVDKKDASIFD